MRNTDKSTIFGMGIAVALVTVICIVLEFSGSTFAGAFLLAAVILLAVFILGVILITVFATGFGRKKDEKDPFSRKYDVPEEVKSAKPVLDGAAGILERIEDERISIPARAICGLCVKITDTAARQPEELEKSALFFSFYLPAYSALLSRYMTMEIAGSIRPELRGSLIRCMKTMYTDLDRLYHSLYSTETVDFTEAAQALEAEIRKYNLV